MRKRKRKRKNESRRGKPRKRVQIAGKTTNIGKNESK